MRIWPTYLHIWNYQIKSGSRTRELKVPCSGSSCYNVKLSPWKKLQMTNDEAVKIAKWGTARKVHISSLSRLPRTSRASKMKDCDQHLYCLRKEWPIEFNIALSFSQANSIWISTCALGKVIPLDVGSGHVRFPSKFAVTWISWISWICMKEGLYVSWIWVILALSWILDLTWFDNLSLFFSAKYSNKHNIQTTAPADVMSLTFPHWISGQFKVGKCTTSPYLTPFWDFLSRYHTRSPSWAVWQKVMCVFPLPDKEET